MDEKQLKDAGERLLKMRRQVLQEVQSASEASRELGLDGVPDIGDMSYNTTSRELLLNLNEAQRKKLHDIDAALERLAEGEYGVCMRCEEEIPDRRMEVRPFSRYCVECKTEVEQFGE